MKPTSEILERINRCSYAHKDGVFTRLYRYLLREDVYFMAYQKLYANTGALTKGTNDDTADGFGKEYVDSIINDLRNGSYHTTPLRRIYIPKRNGKMRPLSIPSFRDKLLQEVIRSFLEVIYEPTFNDWSHGFRPNRSCHTALKQVSHDFAGVPWFIEGDIHACFDCIDHDVLLTILSRKIKDSKFLNIIRAFLKTGYMEDWTYNNTYSGTPQGGIISPILANIYLNELDNKVKEIKERFEQSNSTKRPRPNKEYHSIANRCTVISKKISLMPLGDERDAAIAELKELKQKMLSLPRSAYTDKGIHYVRYADDWLIGVKGSKADCKTIKEEIKVFLQTELKLELSEEKTLITHSSNRVRFLGYDICVSRNQRVKGFRLKSGKWIKKRTLLNHVGLLTPLHDRIMDFMFKKKAIIQKDTGEIRAVHRNELLGQPDADIVRTYNSEIRGILNFYCLSGNYARLEYFTYLMEWSCLCTLARKHDKGIKEIKNMYRDGHGWSIPYGKKNPKRISLVNIRTHHQMFYSDNIREYKFHSYKSSLWKRMQSGYCELCGVKMERPGVVHVVSKLKALGNEPWEMLMKKMRRKTLYVCQPCHKMIHQIG